MAIRIRKIGEFTVALCAALSEPKKEDIYLDDAVHHALITKFGLDWQSMGFVKDSLADERLILLMKKEEFKKQWVIKNGKIIF